MKTFFVAAVIGVLLVTGGVFFDRCINDFSDEMLDRCESLEENAGSKIELVEDIESYLGERRLLLASIINHDHIDEIEVCIGELKGYTEREEYKEANVRCEKLKLLLDRLPQEYGVSLENIL